MVSSTPRPHFTPKKDSVPILQEAGWAPGPVWTGRKSRPHRDSTPDRPARSQFAISTEILSQYVTLTDFHNKHITLTRLNVTLHVRRVLKYFYSFTKRGL